MISKTVSVEGLPRILHNSTGPSDPGRWWIRP